jgi:hypothetical protein
MYGPPRQLLINEEQSMLQTEQVNLGSYGEFNK